MTGFEGVLHGVEEAVLSTVFCNSDTLPVFMICISCDVIQVILRVAAQCASIKRLIFRSDGTECPQLEDAKKQGIQVVTLDDLTKYGEDKKLVHHPPSPTDLAFIM